MSGCAGAGSTCGGSSGGAYGGSCGSACGCDPSAGSQVHLEQWAAVRDVSASRVPAKKARRQAAWGGGPRRSPEQPTAAPWPWGPRASLPRQQIDTRPQRSKYLSQWADARGVLGQYSGPWSYRGKLADAWKRPRRTHRNERIAAPPGSSIDVQQEAQQANENYDNAVSDLGITYSCGSSECIGEGGRAPPTDWVIPDQSEWGSDCYQMRGSTFHDDCTPPPMLVQGGCDCCTSCSGIEDLGFENCDGILTEVIASAWCFLQENIDIVQWVACMVFDNPAKLANYIMMGIRNFIGQSARVRCSESRLYVASTVGFHITLSSVDAGVQGWVDAFYRGNASDRLCATIDCAGVLLHESTHAVGLVGPDADIIGWVFNNDECNQGDIAANTFRWAALQRFSSAMRSDCCNDFFEDSNTKTVRSSLFFKAESVTTYGCDYPECQTTYPEREYLSVAHRLWGYFANHYSP